MASVTSASGERTAAETREALEERVDDLSRRLEEVEKG
jgi:hypothetical protein